MAAGAQMSSGPKGISERMHVRTPSSRGPGYARDQKADARQESLSQCGANNAVDHALDGISGDTS